MMGEATKEEVKPKDIRNTLLVIIIAYAVLATVVILSTVYDHNSSGYIKSMVGKESSAINTVIKTLNNGGEIRLAARDSIWGNEEGIDPRDIIVRVIKIDGKYTRLVYSEKFSTSVFRTSEESEILEKMSDFAPIQKWTGVK